MILEEATNFRNLDLLSLFPAFKSIIQGRDLISNGFLELFLSCEVEI